MVVMWTKYLRKGGEVDEAYKSNGISAYSEE